MSSDSSSDQIIKGTSLDQGHFGTHGSNESISGASVWISSSFFVPTCLTVNFVLDILLEVSLYKPRFNF